MPDPFLDDGSTMKRRRLGPLAWPLTVALLCVTLAAAVSGGCGGNGDRAELALGVEGPQESSSIAAPRQTPLTAYGADSPSRLSLLVDNTHSNWLSVAHGLKAIGVPFSVTTSYREALGHRVILIY